MKNKKTLLISLLVLVVAGIIGVIWSVIDYKAVNKVNSYAYEIVQFDYDGASDGVDPNGNPFNPIDFLTDDIISDGLNRSNLNYEVSDVKLNLAVEGIVPKNIVKEINSYTSVVSTKATTSEITTNDYHPIRYRFVLYQNLDNKLSKSDLSELLSNIVKAYCDKFYVTYKMALNTSSIDVMYNMDSYDYIYQADVYENKITILGNYAKSLYLKHQEFKFDDATFNDLSLKCDALINNNLERIRYVILLNALSKDLIRLKEYYNYKIEDLGYDKIKYTNDLANINAQLAAYDKDSTYYVGSGENIVKVESNSSVTYDTMLTKQISIAEKIGSIDTEITDYQKMLEDINNGVASDEKKALVNSYIVKLDEDYNLLVEDFNKMVEEYNNKYVIDGSISLGSVKYKSSSVISSAFVVRCIKICAPIVLVAAFGVCVYLLVNSSKKKEE